MLLDQLLHVFPYCAFVHPPHALFSERHQQQIARFLLADAARLQVEQRVLLNLPDRCAVCTLHIVRVNLQLRLRVDLRVVAQQQVAIRLDRKSVV